MLVIEQGKDNEMNIEKERGRIKQTKGSGTW